MTNRFKPDDSPAAEAKREESGFYRVVLLSGIFLIVALLAILLVLKVKGIKLIPGKYNPHPTSQLVFSSPGTLT